MVDTPSRAGVQGTYLTQYTYGPTSYGAAFGQGSGWFGPSPPMLPAAPPDVAGRQFDYPVGFNLNTQPRAYAPVTFRELRALADGYDLLRLVIETRKDQLARMSWTIKSRDAAAKDDDDPRVKAITDFFRRPDGVSGWQDWLRAMLEDLFVIDAPALYMQRDRGGRLIELHQVDGATIKPIIDDWGRTPRPYSNGSALVYPAAYQQVLKGIPAVDYSTRDLMYRPRNRRVHTPYGMSQVEQVMTTVNIALRRQLFTLSYFTEGSIPDSFVSVPETWTPDQIGTYQRAWDAYISGDYAARRKVKFVPGGVGKSVHETKTPDLKGEFDEWLAKLICFAFSISPQALTRQMNRASADTQKELAEEEGLEPILLWLKAWIDDIVALEFGAPDLEFSWDDDEVDEAQQVATLTGLVNPGIMTRNEARDRLGLDPLPDAEASQAMVTTGTGLVPLGSFAAQQQQAQENAQMLAEARAKQEAQGGQNQSPGAPGQSNNQPKPQSDEEGAVAKFSPDESRDENGRWTNGSGSTAQDAKDWHAAKDVLKSIGKGVAITALAGLAVGFAPETAAVATAAAIANGVVGGMLTSAAMRSGEVVLRRAGFDTAAIEEKLKPITDFLKASGGGAMDAELKEAIAFTADHARDELINDVKSRHKDAANLDAVVGAINDTHDRFIASLSRMGKSYVLGKRKLGTGWRRPDPLPFDRPALSRSEKAMSARLAKTFAALAPKFATALRSAVSKLAKSDPDPDPSEEDRVRRLADELVDAFDLSDLQNEAAALGGDVEDAVNDTVARAVAQLGPSDADALTNQVNERAVAIARERAAELVGMTYDDAGNLVPSDDAEMAITDTTRGMLRQTIAEGLANNVGLDEIADTIADDYAFSEDRADIIAATEVSRANSMAALESYRGVADAGVQVKKEWLVAAACCDVCAQNAAAGAIDLDDAFPSGDDQPPGHPNCRCALTPVVQEAAEKVVKSGDPDQPRDDHGRWTSEGTGYRVHEQNDMAALHTAEKELKRQALSQDLTPAERKALYDYSGVDHVDINGVLRHGSSHLRVNDNDVDQQIAHLDSAFTKARLPENTMLFRGVSGYVINKVPEFLKPGSVVEDLGFMSTSLKKSVGGTFGDYAVSIAVPKGARAIPLANGGIEHEVLLDRSSRIKILNVDGKDIQAEYLMDRADKLHKAKAKASEQKSEHDKPVAQGDKFTWTSPVGLKVTPPPPGDTTAEDYKNFDFPTRKIPG